MPSEMANFEALLDLPPRERSRRLAELRAEAADVASRLERLLGLIPEDLEALDAEAADPRLGTCVDRWTLERRIGEGASSIVYLGRADDGSAVAVKILRLERLGESSRRRFEREIAAHARLEHPGFARLIASDLAAVPPWLAAEWVEDGLPITDWASLHAPSIDDRVRLVEQLREALGAAREAGVVHRDLSPNNVLVDRHGRVKIVDLGIARLFAEGAESAGFSRTGRHAIGTPAYMAPEQVDPSFGPIGPWTDEYAAALIAYRLFTGKLPYDTSGSLASVAQAIVHVPVEAMGLEEVGGRIGLAQWIDRCLRKRAGNRQAGYRELVRLKATGLAGTGHSRSISGPKPQLRWIKSLSVGAGFVALVGLSATHSLPNRDRSVASSGLESQGTLGEIKMKRKPEIMALALAVAGTCRADSFPAAAQWTVAEGGNGHWYALEEIYRGWPQARQYAEGRGAYLVTITSRHEGVFIHQNVSPQNFWAGGSRSNGVWSWVTGEPWVYEPWNCYHCHPSCQPDFASENYLEVMCWDGTELKFQNYSQTRFSVFEWSADCNNDGIVDFGQIRAGELDDANANNIPDCCEQGTSCNPCLADLDGSGAVNSVDLAVILAAWGTAGGKYPQADIDGNGTVDAADLSQVLSAWGPCPQ
jgi:tRNA A-37 threonylcarbamoyl transferase component Bud32